MKRALQTAAALLVAAVVAAGTAPVAPAQAPPDPGRLQPLGFLAGSCWKGTFPGRTVTDEHCFEWMYQGRFLRDRHVVQGDTIPYQGETTYAWDARQRRIVYWYIALPGFHSSGHVEVVSDTLVFRDNLVTAGAPRQLRNTWRRAGADAYMVLVQELTSAGVKELWSMEMRRSRAVTSPP